MNGTQRFFDEHAIAIASDIETKLFVTVKAIGGAPAETSVARLSQLCPEYVGNCVAAGLSASGLVIRDNKLVKVF